MILEMKVPSPGESISEVEIAHWLVKDGDYVEKDQTIAEVDSDKATLDLPAEDSGIITLKAAVGESVNVGDIVCLIDTSAEKSNQNNLIDNNPKDKVQISDLPSVDNDKILESQPKLNRVVTSPSSRKIWLKKISILRMLLEKQK